MESTSHTTGPRYSGVAIAIHWVVALLILLNFSLVWYAESLPKAERMPVMGNHFAVGLLVLALTVLRVVWRLMHRPPELVSTLSRWEATLARLVHTGFYILMLALPLSGWAMVSAASKGKPLSFFGLFEVPALPVGKAIGDLGHEGHEVFALLMLVLFALHVLGALKHMVIDRDGTMRRIMPWG